MESNIQTTSVQIDEPIATPLTPAEVLLNEVRNGFSDQQRANRSHLRLLRFCAACMGIVAGMVVILVLAVLPPLTEALHNISAATATLNESDLAGLISDVQALTDDSAKAIANATDTLEAFDIETLNQAIANLDETVTSFAELDIETLNTAIANLNSTVEPMAKFFNKFK